MNTARHQVPLETLEIAALRLDQGPYRGRRWPIHYDSVEPLAIAIDLITIFATSILTGSLYHLQTAGSAGGISRYLGSAILVSALFVPLMKMRGMYKPKELLVLSNQVRVICLSWTTVFLLLAGTVFALKIGSEISRGASILFASVGLGALIIQRSLLRDILKRGLTERRFSGRSIVLVTEGSHLDEAELARALAGVGFHIDKHYLVSRSNGDKKKLVESIIEHARASDIDEIFVGADPNRWAELRFLIGALRVLPVPVSFVPTGTTSELFRRPSRELGNTLCVELQRGPLSSLEHFTKRWIDVALAGTALIVFSPLLAIVAVAIKLDSPGPALFRQRRCGFNGKSFTIRKFRTMSVLEDGPNIVQARSADDRVTRLGKWLRRTSIDELPQLLNVLEGSMSVVGPRPHAIAHDNEFDKIVRNYAFRRRVKPGLTGLAQIKGCRGPLPTTASIEQRVGYDLWYIDNWSLQLDLMILLQTPFELIRGRNAY